VESVAGEMRLAEAGQTGPELSDVAPYMIAAAGNVFLSAVDACVKFVSILFFSCMHS
jgi:hypothetical protein